MKINSIQQSINQLMKQRVKQSIARIVVVAGFMCSASIWAATAPVDAEVEVTEVNDAAVTAPEVVNSESADPQLEEEYARWKQDLEREKAAEQEASKT